MSEIPLRATGEEEPDGTPILRRVMSAEEVRERAELNVANTASRLRARVLASSNGHRPIIPADYWTETRPDGSYRADWPR